MNQNNSKQQYSCPKKIYKYLDFEGAKKTLQTQNVKFTKGIHLNDPFDLAPRDIPMDLEDKWMLPAIRERCKAHFIKPLYEKEEYTALMQEIDRDQMLDIDQRTIINCINERQKLINRHLNHSIIFCATTNKYNLAMWTHYADQHKGAVIEFTPNEKKGSFFLLLQKVQYQERMPLIFNDKEEFMKLFVSGGDEAHMMKKIEQMIYTKSLDWSYEQEYRMRQMISEEEGLLNKLHLLKFHDEELTSIYLGCNLGAKEKNILKLEAQKINPDVAIYHANISRTEYKLEFSRI